MIAAPREVYLHDHARGIVAVLFEYENGATDVFHIRGFAHIGRYATLADAAGAAAEAVGLYVRWEWQ